MSGRRMASPPHVASLAALLPERRSEQTARQVRGLPLADQPARRRTLKAGLYGRRAASWMLARRLIEMPGSSQPPTSPAVRIEAPVQCHHEYCLAWARPRQL